MVDVDVEVLVHGGEGGSVAELLGGQPAVHHVVVEGIQKLDVHVAHQSVQDLLQHSDMPSQCLCSSPQRTTAELQWDECGVFLS